MKKIACLFLWMLAMSARPATVTYNTTNGQLLHPSNFFLQHVLPGAGMITQYGTGTNTLTLVVLTNSISSPGFLPPWVADSLWYNGAWTPATSIIGGGSGTSFTIAESPATNLWDNGIIVPVDGGGGNWSLEYGNESIGTNKISVAFYEWLLSNFGSGGGTTNGFGINGTFRTDWNFINSAALAATVSGGTNWYLSLVDASVTTNKIDSTFRTWVESMAGGGGTNYTQFWHDLTNSVVASNNIVLAYNEGTKKLLISSTAAGGDGTAVSFNGGGTLTAVNFTNSVGITPTITTTNATFSLVDRDFGSVTVSSSGTVITYDNGSISSNHIAAGQVSIDKLGTSGTPNSSNTLFGNYQWRQVTTNDIPGLNDILSTISTNGGGTTSDVYQRTGFGYFRSTLDDIADSEVSGSVSSITHQSGDGSNEMVVNVVLTARSSTNYVVVFEISNTNDLDTEGPATLNIADKTTTGFTIQGQSASGGAQPNGFLFRFWIIETTTVGGSGSGDGFTFSVNSASKTNANAADSATIEVNIDGSDNLTWLVVSGSIDIAQLAPSLYEQITNTTFSELFVGTLNLTNRLTVSALELSASPRLIGRYSASGGVAQEVTIGSGLTLDSGTGVLSATGGGGSLSVNATNVSTPNLQDNFHGRFGISSSNITVLPRLPVTASSTSFTPDFSATKVWEYTLSGNATLNAPSNVSTDMVGQGVRMAFIQGSGGQTLTLATNYLFGTDVTGVTLSTGAGVRDYVNFVIRRTNVFDVVGISRGYAP
jgi:hypothetical protein